MSGQMTCEAILSATSSPVSESGRMLSAWQGGATIGQSGPEAAPAPRSRRQEKGSNALLVAANVICATLARPDISSASIADVIAMPTKDTFGLSFPGSSASAKLQSSLGSRLRQRLDTAGLIELSVTWKDLVTPAGLRYCKRVARTLPTSATGSGSLPTPSGVSGRGHMAGRMDEWGGSSNPFRGTPLGPTHSPSFELWMMGYPATWREQMPPAMPSSRRSRRSS